VLAEGGPAPAGVEQVWRRCEQAPGHPARGTTGPAYVDERTPRRQVIVGDPARCVEALEYWRETLGLTAVSGQFHFGGMPQELAQRSLRLFAEQVMPAFRG
jgi:alkanesulfonate monooxygenase SsuD/methylene tetrahydromethanopterin reductase-like flavin-dependent oxidoreductase (luciferase family)